MPAQSRRIAMVTGASRGIGRAIALRLARDGFDIAVCARSADQLATLAAEIEGLGRRVHSVAVDLMAEGAPGAFVASTLAALGGLDLVVTNAGATERGNFVELTEAQWRNGYALKFFAHVWLLQAAWPHLAQTGGKSGGNPGGRVVLVAGIGGRTPGAEFAIGGSVNAALLSLTKALAEQGLKDGVRVNAINPGPVRTDRLTRRIRSYAAENQISEAAAAQRMEGEFGVVRFGEVEDIAAAVAFLAGPEADYFQGSLIDLDGGQTKTL
ncbi:SDR family NAD(P)-dependent oxidoreductase [Oceanibaculum pacificum]|uniref:SDR family NAD(P)-dependent oxidoreductase n=1 Tax=Oceanibaculum pacificum TaxID=580166 RepID=UPI0009FF13FB|nr:SDR family NAD(P)-dependent oxidoreductase [Oceanibaculum pacificum]